MYAAATHAAILASVYAGQTPGSGPPLLHGLILLGMKIGSNGPGRVAMEDLRCSGFLGQLMKHTKLRFKGCGRLIAQGLMQAHPIVVHLDVIANHAQGFRSR